MKARDDYKAIPDDKKNQVTNYSDLVNAEQTLSNLSINKIVGEIASIGNVTLDKENLISDINAECKALSQEERDKISNYNVLKSASDTVDSLRAQKKLADQREQLRGIVRVSKVTCSSPNSAGGVDVYVWFTNNSSKTIKYIDFTVEPYNAVGDMVTSEIGGKSSSGLRATGPYATGQGISGGKYWPCVWYNFTIESIKLTKINIEYMDGTTITLSGNDIDAVRY